MTWIIGKVEAFVRALTVVAIESGHAGPIAFAEVLTGVKLQCRVLKCGLDGWAVGPRRGDTKKRPRLVSGTFDIVVVD